MTELDQPLADTTVLELGHILAGPYCTLLLADMGAQVTKIEHPEHGDALRGLSERSASTFNYLNRNKKGMTIDLKTDEGHDLFLELVDDADVIVENYGPGAVESLGVDYETVRDRNEAIVYCSIKGFNDGPYSERPALDPVAEAQSGLMSITGYPDHPPARCGASVADMTASLHGALAVVAALRQREHTGKGQHITSPLFEGAVGLLGGDIAYSNTYGEPQEPLGGGYHGAWAPYDVFEAGDGRWFFLGCTSEKHWETLCDAIDLGDIAQDAKFRTLDERRANREELDSRLQEIFAGYSRDDLVEHLIDKTIPFAPVNDTVEAGHDPHLRETGGFVEVEAIQESTRIDVPASPVRSTGRPRVEPSDPPHHGEHTGEILRSMGYAEEEIAALRERGAIS